jgi:hypothetical protein
MIKEKEHQYREYISDHIKNVQLIWKNVHDKLQLLDDTDFHVIDILINIHDESKLTDQEFHGYRENFYPEDEEDSNNDHVKKCFDVAWNHHQKSNPHHWQYWVLVEDKDNTKILSMPFVYIIEMLCDWSAMSLKFNDKPSEFYNNSKARMILSKDTSKCIERFIGVFDNVVEQLTKEGN